MTPSQASTIRESLEKFDALEREHAAFEERLSKLRRWEAHSLEIDFVGVSAGPLNIPKAMQPQLREWLIAQFEARQDEIRTQQTLLSSPTTPE